MLLAGRTSDRSVRDYLLIEFQPSRESFCVLVLKTKEPNFPQANCFHHLEKNKRVTGLIAILCQELRNKKVEGT